MAENASQEATIKSTLIDVKDYTRADQSVGHIYNIAAADGKVYTTFSDTIKDVFAGPAGQFGVERKIKFETRVKGQYTNYVIVDVANEQGEFTEGGKSYKGRGAMKADPAKTESIERQVALKESVNLIINKVVTWDDFEVTADRLIGWLKGADSEANSPQDGTAKSPKE